MRLNFEKKIIIHVLLFLTVILAIGGAVIWPTVEYIQSLNRETFALRMYMEKRYESAKHDRYSKQKAGEIKKEVENFTDLNFHSANQLDLITALENIAEKNEMTQKIDNLNLNKESHSLTLSLNTQGEFTDSLKYLADVEKTNYFLQVQKLVITPVFEHNQQSSSTKMYLELKLYVTD